MTGPSWRYRVGRLLQLMGLLILPFAIASELMEKVHLGQSLLIAAGGAALFYVGVQLQAQGGVSPRSRSFAQSVAREQGALNQPSLNQGGDWVSRGKGYATERSGV